MVCNTPARTFPNRDEPSCSEAKRGFRAGRRFLTDPGLQALGIVDHLRCRFACLNLCAHILDLRCLLLHRCRKRGDFLLLPRDGSLLLCGIRL